MQREASGELDLQRLLVPLTNPEGNIEAWCAAVPYLRSADLRLEQELAEGEDRLVEGVRQIYRQTRITSYNVCYTKLLRSCITPSS